nr:putative reverse transcriptase domain-containing protein [Tanacetum cinerariifolium]
MEESLSKFMAKSTKKHDENSNLIKEIRASADAAIRNQGASIKALEFQIRQMSKLTRLQYVISIHPIRRIDLTEQNAVFKPANLGASVSVIPYSTFINLGLGKLAPTRLISELADRTRKRPKGIAKNVLVCIDKFVFPVDFIVLDMPEDIKVPLILRRQFSFTAHAKIDVFKKKITLRVGNEKIMLKIIENMDAYRDDGMGDVIVGKTFCKEVCIKTRRFDGMITIYNGNEEHLEQPEYVNDTYLVKQGDTHTTPDSSDICNNGREAEHDDELVKEREFLASLIEQMKHEINESKQNNNFLESSNKALREANTFLNTKLN